MGLSVHNLDCRRGSRTVFEGVSFSAQAGDVIVLTGANGSGKTSLLRILAGLLAPAGGTVARDGFCVWAGTDDPLKPDLGARDNLAFWGRSDLGTLDLERLADMPARYLSRGQQRRVSLSRLFGGDEKIWLLDEPETGLDAAAVGRLAAAVRAHADAGGIAVIGTHRPELWGGARVVELSGHIPSPPSAPAPLGPPSRKRAGGEVCGGGRGGFAATFRRDMGVHRRRAGRAATAPLFFIMAVALFPLGLPPDTALLQSAAAGVLGMAALFAALLSVDRLFDEDRRDGTLDALHVAGAPFALYAAGRMAAAWVASALPLVLVSPVLGLILGLGAGTCLFLPLVLIPATMLLLLFGALGAALVSGARQGTVLLALAVLPLYSPVLIFMSGAIDLHRAGGRFDTPFLLLLSMLAVALPAVPVVAAGMVRRLVKG